jgi:hypothetical protein
VTISERIEAGRRERRVLTRVSRAGWRLEQGYSQDKAESRSRKRSRWSAVVPGSGPVIVLDPGAGAGMIELEEVGAVRLLAVLEAAGDGTSWLAGAPGSPG